MILYPTATYTHTCGSKTSSCLRIHGIYYEYVDPNIEIYKFTQNRIGFKFIFDQRHLKIYLQYLILHLHAHKFTLMFSHFCQRKVEAKLSTEIELIIRTKTPKTILVQYNIDKNETGLIDKY